MKQRHRIIRTAGQRIAWLNTSPIPDEQIRDAIRFVAQEVDLDRTVIHVKRHGRRRWSWGMAYKHIPSIANLNGLNRWQWRYLITVTDHGCSSVTADFVSTLAHEAKHVEQFRERLKISEVRCNAFGSWVADRFLQSRTAPEGAARTHS